MQKRSVCFFLRLCLALLLTLPVLSAAEKQGRVKVSYRVFVDKSLEDKEGNVDANRKDEAGTPLLIQAIKARDITSIKYLLDKKADPNLRDAQNRTSLHIAAGHYGLSIPCLLDADAEVDAIASGAITPLMSALAGKFPENAALLLEHGAKINARDYLGREPLHYACLSGELAGVFFALEAGADIEARDNEGYTPLLTLFRGSISRERASEIADYLLAKGANINCDADNGDTLIRLSERFHDVHFLKRLAERGARLTWPEETKADSANASAAFLLYCVEKGHTTMASFLAMSCDPALHKFQNDKGETALHLAVAHNRPDLVRDLIKAGFNVNAQRNDGMTPLHLTVKRFGNEIIPILLLAGARPDIADQKGETVLDYADKKGDQALYDQLITLSQLSQAGPSTASHYFELSKTSLIDAIKNNRRLSVERLLKEPRNVDEHDEEGNTALHYAISRYSHLWAVTLLDAGANPVAANNQGITPLHLAAAKGNLYLTRLFLERGVPVDLTDKNGQTPLFSAIENKHLPVAELLLKSNANINHSDNEGRTPLFCSIRNDPLLCTFAWLVKKGAEVNVADKRNKTVFHELMYSRPEKYAVARLLRLGGDPLYVDKWGDCPLTIGMSYGLPEIVDFFFEQKPDFAAMAKRGRSILHNWAMAGQVSYLQRALATGVDVNLKNAEGDALIFAAVHSQNASVTALLVEKGADLNCHNAHGITFLEKAIVTGKTSIVRIILDAGVDVNGKNNEGLPPIFAAIGHWNIFDLLLSRGAKADFTLLAQKNHQKLRQKFFASAEGIVALRKLSNYGLDLNLLVFPGENEQEKYTQVKEWARTGMILPIKLALDLGFDLKTSYRAGYTLLHQAAFYGQLDLVKKLIEWGAPLDATSDNGETPLSYALSNIRHVAVPLLIEAGANIKVTDTETGGSLLHLAAGSNAVPEIIDLLISRGIKINCLDRHGGTPLLWAADISAEKALLHLLELGAEPNLATDVASASPANIKSEQLERFIYTKFNTERKWRISGITPLARAAAKNELMVVRRLLAAGARVDLADGLGNTPMHIALMCKARDVAELLLTYNPAPQQKNEAGKDLIELADEAGYHDLALTMWKINPAQLKNSLAKQQNAIASESFPLHKAVCDNELIKIRMLVQSGCRVDQLDAEKKTPLWRAVEGNNSNAVKILLQLGASPNYDFRGDDTPWLHAVRKAKLDIIDAMVESGVDIDRPNKAGDTALHLAARAHLVSVVKRLLGLHADLGKVNNLGRTPLMEAVVTGENLINADKCREFIEKINAKMQAIKEKAKKRRRWPPFKKLKKLDTRSARTLTIEALAVKHSSVALADIYGQTVLHMAAGNSNADVIKKLVSIGAELEVRDRNGRTPIFHAITTGNLVAINDLISRGTRLDIVDNRGETPLSLTDSLNLADIARILCDAGVPLKSIVPRWSVEAKPARPAIIRAASENRHQAVVYLLDHGSDPDETDSAGETALFYAVRSGMPAMVELLLKHGADRDFRNQAGQKPLDLALEIAKHDGRPFQIGLDSRARLMQLEQQKSRMRIIELLTPSGSDARELGN